MKSLLKSLFIWFAFVRAVTGNELCLGDKILLHVNATNATTLVAQWERPSWLNVTSYVVEVFKANCHDQRRCMKINKTIADPQMTYAVLTGLKTWTCYEVGLLVYSDNSTCRSNVLRGRTLHAEDEICTPLNVIGTNSTSFTLKWLKPSRLDVSNYTVEFTQGGCQSQNMCMVMNRTVLESYILRHTITNLKLWTCYQVRILVETKNATCFSNTSVIRTLEGVPTEVRNLSAINATDTSVTLVWSEPMSKNGHVRYRVFGELQYPVLENTYQFSFKNIVDTTHYIATGLEEFSLYKVTIQPFTSTGGNGTTTVIYIRTLTAKPSGMPRNLSTKSVTPSSVILTWTHPKPLTQNGLIIRYLVNVASVDQTRNESTKGNATLLRVTFLRPFTAYRFAVKAANLAGEGPEAVINVITSEGKPGAFLNFTCVRRTNTSLTVHWQSPIDKNGIIRATELNWTKASEEAVQPYSWKSHIITNSTLMHTVTELGVYTNYTFVIRGKTSEWGNTSYIICRTCESAPTGAPLNVTGRNLTSTSVKISWSPPPLNKTNGELRYYILRYREVNCASRWRNITVPVTPTSIPTEPTSPRPASNELYQGVIPLYNLTQPVQNWTTLNVSTTNYEIKQLSRPWVCVEAQVAARTIDIGPYSPSVFVRSSEDVPEPPIGLQAVNLTSESLRVSWKDPVYPNGIIRRFRLRYQIRGSNHWQQREYRQGIYTERISGLRVYTEYELQIQASTAVGWGNFSAGFNVYTDEDVPGVPGFFSARNISAIELLLNWTQPVKSNGIILGYLLQYRRLNDDEETVGTFLNREFGPRDVAYRLQGLDIFSVYEIKLSAKTRKGYGNASRLIVRTDQEVPSRPEDFVVQNYSAFHAFLTWSKLSTERGIIFGYKLQLCQQNVTDIFHCDAKINLTESRTSYNFTSLQPYTNYSFRLSGFTVKGEGNFSVIYLRTSESAPSSVRFIRVTNASARSLTVSWLQPLKPNGVVYYRVYYRLASDDESKNNQSQETGSLTAEVTNLEEYHEYVVTVEAYTKRGGSSLGVEVRGVTHTAAPTGPPLSLNAQADSSTSVNLTWHHPEYLLRNGIITDYRITYNGSSGTTESLEVGSNATFYRLVRLNIFQTYLVRVFPVNIAGTGPAAEVTVRTQQDVPGITLFETCHNVSNSTLHVAWKPPKESNGKILAYNLTWQYNGTFTVTKKGEWRQFSANERNANIENLETFSWYWLTISASTVKGWGAMGRQRCQTGESLPTMPMGLRVTLSTSSTISIAWDRPERANGILLGYNISWKHGEDQKSAILEPSRTTYTIEGLRPFTSYKLSVSARTSIGYGIAAELVYKTSESVPTAVRNVKFDVKETKVKIDWEKPLHENGVVKYRILYRMTLKPLKEFEFYAETQELSQTIINLEEYIEYEIKIVPFTGAGNGPPMLFSITTLAAAPSGPPLNVTAKALDSTSVSIAWEPPAFFHRNGDIFRYRISSTEPGLASKEESNTRITWDKLKEYYSYTFYVAACTKVGCGPTANVSVRTQEDKPGSPRLLGYVNISSTEIEVQWLPPLDEDLNGIIRGYKLELLPDMPEPRQIVYVYNASTRAAHVVSLEKYTKYEVSLYANTSVGWGTADVEYYLTKDDKPDGPPVSVRIVTKSSSSVTIKWDPPQAANGIILSYSLRFGKSNIAHRKVLKLFSSPREVTGLAPFTRYSFEIACLSSGGLGPYSSPVTATTEIDRPPKPTGAVPQPTIPTKHDGFAVRLWAASNAHGLVKYYWVVVLELKIGSDGNALKPSKEPSEYKKSEIVTYAKYKTVKKSQGEILPYIAGYVKYKEFPADGIFNVGDGKVYYPKNTRRRRRSASTYFNGPLDPSSSYMVFERAFVSETLFTSTKWLGPFVTVSKPTTSPPPPGGAIAGAVVGVLLVLFLSAAAVYYLRTKGYLAVKKVPKEENDDVSLDDIGPENPGFDGEHRPPDRPIKVENFAIHHQHLNKDGKYRFSEEFKLLRNGAGCTYVHSHHEINKPKNRYTNIVAYDHTRVTLSPFDGIPESDYINANYIDGYTMKREYIATQGPLEHTTEDFWRMVWEQDSTLIVMLTRLEENGKIKCYQYWPEAGSIRFGCMQITTIEASEMPDYCVRTFSVINNLVPSQEKFVKQFHFLAWPDHGVPSANAILSFLRRVRTATVSKVGPIVVHCSAGVGRTGTYMVLDANLQRIAAEGNIEIYNYLQHLRSQRNLMVQVEPQYIFIHDCLLEYINCGSTEIAAKDLRDYVRKLQRPLDDSDELGLDREFSKLNSYDRFIQKNFSGANMLSNKNKNRFLNILPFDDTRVCLRMIPGVQGSDYINASFIDGYTYQRGFIATQAPLPSTIPDFWRMVWEQQCSTIVCLVKESDASKMVKVHRYWPLLESAMHGSFIIEQVGEKKYTDYITRDLKITHTQEGHSHVVRQFHYIGWPDNSMPESGATIIDLIGQVQKWQEQTGNNAIVVHCSTGVGRSGVFIAVYNMIQRVRSEGVVDVFQTVRKLRVQRPAMVQTKAQYLFCYIVLQDYLASFDIYASFM